MEWKLHISVNSRPATLLAPADPNRTRIPYLGAPPNIRALAEDVAGSQWGFSRRDRVAHVVEYSLARQRGVDQHRRYII